MEVLKKLFNNKYIWVSIAAIIVLAIIIGVFLSQRSAKPSEESTMVNTAKIDEEEAGEATNDEATKAGETMNDKKLKVEEPNAQENNATEDNSDTTVAMGDAKLLPVTAHPKALVVEAEKAILSGGANVQSNHTGFTGSGFVAGYDNNGNAKTTFTIDMPSDGTYFISLRYSAGDVAGWPKDRTVGFVVNELEGKITLAGTDASWNTWEEFITKIELKEGKNTIAFTNLTSNDNSDCINLDKISIWAYSESPVVDAVAFTSTYYNISEGYTTSVSVNEVNSNGVILSGASEATYSSSDTSIFTIDQETGYIKGIKEGKATLIADYKEVTAECAVIVHKNPTLSIDFFKLKGKYSPSTFGWILTPNYDVPNSRLTLLGPMLNRETIPAQNFQAISDLDGSYYRYEDSILQRILEAYHRAKDNGLSWYMLLGMSPSWAAPSGGPIDSMDNVAKKSELDQIRFKQYIKDTLQYLRDNDAYPDFADLTNEYWTGTQKTFQGNWEALREVYPEFIPAVGPGAVGFNGIPDFYIPYASSNNITLEGPAWHAYWTSDTYAPYSTLLGWRNTIAKLQEQYPEVNGKYIIWEENNAGSKDPTDWTRSMSNVLRTGVSFNIKGCLEPMNANGMSDLLTTNTLEQNPAARRPIWWVYYMFSQLSGQIVEVSTDLKDDFTGIAAIDKDEAKIIIAKNGLKGSVKLDLHNMPYQGEMVDIDCYKITSSELAGLEYQYTKQVKSSSELEFILNDIEANESLMLVIRKQNTKPSFFYPMTPDDGEITLIRPTLTWSASKGADKYTVVVSKLQDLSNPVIKKEGISDTNYTVEKDLEIGQRYYWTVIAENGYGTRGVSYDTVYSLIVGENTKVPGQFGPYLPSLNAQNEPVLTEFKWSRAYNADSYRIVISMNKDLSNPVIDEGDIRQLANTGMYGPQSQVVYRVKTLLEFDTTYYWMVYAVNEHGERQINGPLRYFTTKGEGNEPHNFTYISPSNKAKNVSAREILSWESSKNAFFYQLEVSINKDLSNPVIYRDRMIYNRYTIEPNVLKPDTTYYWKVTAFTKDLKYSTEISGGVQSFHTESVPCSPLLYAHVPGDRQVTLYFEPIDGAKSYKLMYGKEPGNYIKTISGITSSPYTVMGLDNEQEYYFAVVAVNSKGQSSIWNERSEMPKR